MLCFRVLTDYLHLLEDWKPCYTPKTPDDEWDDRFVEALQMLCHIEYMADVLTVGDLEERVSVVDKLMKEGKIAFLKSGHRTGTHSDECTLQGTDRQLRRNVCSTGTGKGNLHKRFESGCCEVRRAGI